MPSDTHLQPGTPEELAEVLREAGSAGRTITLSGAETKRQMAGPIPESDVHITTTGLRRLLIYEPNDLTVSVEAGMPWSEFTATLAQNHQMVLLDPPFASTSTVGGVIAANCSGPRRRLYGTARDLVIGMKFVTLEGKIVQSGGMVVKNVAGLDMGKLMIGSFGTLAAIAVVNFKLAPAPPVTRHFLLSYQKVDAASQARAAILKGVLQPASLDRINPAAAKFLGLEGHLLSIQVGGNAAVVDRYQRELATMGDLSDAPGDLATRLQEMTPAWLATHESGCVVRTSSTLKQIPTVVSEPAPAVARAGSGVTYLYYQEPAAAADYLLKAGAAGLKAIMEFSPETKKQSLDLWPTPGPDFEIMKRVKSMFDPRNLLNRGRLYSQL